ncbi:sugar transferase [Caenispirillum salinarum AK4]|uniref:Sugar transferase n=1 Tax=Caenispirillum salinarum AK4 TaxID=1238182 RepID=K9H3D3_9PROT|nr:TIGR03013 family XrtA/PEP-CTERM system glycosyltransferase [Caenispirillum salinarum]EKV32765.1 sugar transferase [Caenispirillum salinarum AK4]
MMRVFGHHIAVPVLLLASLEAGVLVALFEGLTAFFDVAPAAGPGGADAVTGALGAPAAAWGDHTVPRLLAVLGIVVIAAVGMYSRRMFFDVKTFVRRSLVIFPLLFVALTAASVAYAMYMGTDWSGYVILLGFATPAAAVAIVFIRYFFVELADLDVFKRRILVLGTGPAAERIAEMAAPGQHRHFRLVGFVDMEDGGAGAGRLHWQVFPRRLAGEPAALHRLVRDRRVDEIVLATAERRAGRGGQGGGLPLDDLLKCKLGGVTISDYATFWEREAAEIDLDSLRPGWMIFSDGFRQSLSRRFIKRLFDVSVSLTFLVATLPITAAAAAAVKLTSRGPVFYRQERVGLHGRPFELLKFRSMTTDAEKDGKPRWAGANDARVTPVGRFIRKTRIDEIPQVLNVLKGEMSFIGPRPERPFFVDQLAEQIPYYRERHTVRPGISGWAQINYPYGASVEDARRKLAYDLYYVKNGSLFLDLLILVQTVKVILWNEGAR